MLKPQSEFPLLDKYKEKFEITPNTIFAYDGNIYSNSELSPDLMVHEETHLKQQEAHGLDNWVDKFLNDPEFRLWQEVDAYKKQLASIKDREFRFHIRQECIANLSSSLYGNIVSKEQAKNLLK